MERLLPIIVLLALAGPTSAAPDEPDYARLAAECRQERESRRQHAVDEYGIAQLRTVVIDRLELTGRAEDQLARALLGHDDDAVVDAAMADALAIKPNDPLVLEAAVGRCAAHPDNEWCSPELTRRWLESDPGNLRPYLAQMAHHVAEDDLAAAGQMILAAAASADSRTPWGTFAAIVANGMSTGAESVLVSEDTLALAGIGIEQSMVHPGESSLTWVCGNAATDVMVAGACAQVGRMLIGSGSTIDEQSIGMAVVRHVSRDFPEVVPASELAEIEQLAQVTERARDRFQYLTCRHGLSHAQWLREVLAHGELQAMQRISDSLEARAQAGSATDRSVAEERLERPRMEMVSSVSLPTMRPAAPVTPAVVDEAPVQPPRNTPRSWWGGILLVPVLLLGLILLRR